jgi:hypothetical protein
MEAMQVAIAGIAWVVLRNFDCFLFIVFFFLLEFSGKIFSLIF